MSGSFHKRYFQGDRTFTDVTEEANLGPKKNGSGAVWADFDADGDLDLYVTSIGDKRHFLYINQVRRPHCNFRLHPQSSL